MIPLIQELFKFERLDLFFYQYTVDSSGNITQVTLRLVNNGTKTLTINKVYVNETFINSTEWRCHSGKTVPPKFWQWMYIAPKSTIFKEGHAYNITIGTEVGNSFPYIIKVTREFVAEEEVRISGGDFLPAYRIPGGYGGYKVFIYIDNNGTVPAIVVDGWVNGTRNDIGRTWVFPGDVGAEGIAVTFHVHWTSGNAYNFTIRTASRNLYTYIETADG